MGNATDQRLRLVRRMRGTLGPRLRWPKDRLQRVLVRPIQEEMDCDSRTLLIAFGGLRGRIDIPPFEFLNLTREFPVKRLYVRDLHQAWYHRGIPRHRARTLRQTAELLRRFVDREQVERVVTVGNSSGGYAALAFAALLEADVALAFSPQTVIDPDVLAGMGDLRWVEQLRQLRAAGRLDSDWIDLREALARVSARTRYNIYFNHPQRADRLHAERLRGVEGVRLYRFGHRSGHFLVSTMRANATLGRALREAVRAAVAQPAAPSQSRS